MKIIQLSSYILETKLNALNYTEWNTKTQGAKYDVQAETELLSTVMHLPKLRPTS